VWSCNSECPPCEFSSCSCSRQHRGVRRSQRPNRNSGLDQVVQVCWRRRRKNLERQRHHLVGDSLLHWQPSCSEPVAGRQRCWRAHRTAWRCSSQAWMPRCCTPLSGPGRQTTDCPRDVGRVCGSCMPLLRLWHGSRTAGANRLVCCFVLSCMLTCITKYT